MIVVFDSFQYCHTKYHYITLYHCFPPPLFLAMTLSHQIIRPPETSPALHGLASARPSRFLCFFLKPLFQRMARSARLEVRYVISTKDKGFDNKIKKKLGAYNRLDTQNILLFHLFRAISLGLQDCAHREPPGTRNTHQSWIP